jgi:hypothetical protein
MPLWVLIPNFPVSEDFGSFSHVLFDLLIQAGKKFANRSSIYRLIRQRRPKAWLAGELFVTTHLDSLIFAFEAQQKSHFLLFKPIVQPRSYTLISKRSSSLQCCGSTAKERVEQPTCAILWKTVSDERLDHPQSLLKSSTG